MDDFDLDEVCKKWMGFSLYLLQFCGIWPLSGIYRSKRVKFLHYINLSITASIFSLFYLTQGAYIYHNPEAESIMRTLPLMLAYFETLFRDFIVVSRRQKFEGLLERLEAFHQRTLDDEECATSWKSTFHLAHIYRTVFFWCIFIGTYMFWFFPLIEMMDVAAYQNTTLPIPFQLYQPFDMNTTEVYAGVYLMECLIMLRLTTSFIAADCFIITVMAHTGGQLKVLNILLRKIHITAKKNLSTKRFGTSISGINKWPSYNEDRTGRAKGNEFLNSRLDTVNEDDNLLDKEYNKYETYFGEPVFGFNGMKESSRMLSSSQAASLNGKNKQFWEKLSNNITNISDVNEEHDELNNEMDRCLKDFITLHQGVIKFVKDLQEQIGAIMLAQFSVNSVTLCLTLYKGISSSELTPTSAAKFLMFFFNISLELFLICKCGEDIMAESSRLHSSMYECDWLEASKKFKSHCLILMARAQKPLSIRAGNFYHISLETFRQFMNASYSFYTLIRQVNTETL